MDYPMGERARTARPIAWTALALALLAPLPAIADLYKCVGDDSAPVYQDTPCRPGRELRDFQSDPATVSVVPFAKPAPAAKSAAPAAAATPPPERTTRHKTFEPKVLRHSGKPAVAPGKTAERRFLHAGMSEAEVLAKIGAPDIRSGGSSRKSGARWSYLPADGDPGMITTLHFQAGQVTQIDRQPSR